MAKRNPLIRKSNKMTGKGTGGHKSAGILDDFAVRKVIATKEGSITKVPVEDIDIVNKKYVDTLTTNHPHQDVTTTASPDWNKVTLTNSITCNQVLTTGSSPNIGTSGSRWADIYSTNADFISVNIGDTAQPMKFYTLSNDNIIESEYQHLKFLTKRSGDWLRFFVNNDEKLQVTNTSLVVKADALEFSESRGFVYDPVGNDLGIVMDGSMDLANAKIVIQEGPITINGQLLVSDTSGHIINRVVSTNGSIAQTITMRRDLGASSQSGDGLRIRMQTEDDTNSFKNLADFGARRLSSVNETEMVFSIVDNGALTEKVNINSSEAYFKDLEVRNEKAKMTAMGGFAILLTNKSGSNSIGGNVVEADSANNDAVVVTTAGDVDPIGVFLDSGIADGSEAWVVVSGIADVMMEDNVASVRGNWIGNSTSENGVAANSASPPAAPTHFNEMGHCIESVAAGGAGTNILARCVLHFN